MTGWKMKEHGVPDSRLVVIRRVEDYIQPNGHHVTQWLCECECEEHNQITVYGSHLRNGNTLSCGCIQKEMASISNRKVNVYNLEGEYGILWATNTNEEIYFDLDNADKILGYTWYIDAHGYPTTSIGKQRIKMHILLGYKHHDHHNRNKKDNRVENLVPCTIRENNRNKSLQANNKSGVAGVSWHKASQKWRARIVTEVGEQYLGVFVNKEDAIRVRLQAEKKYFGDFAPQKHLYEQYGIEIQNNILNKGDKL